MIKKRSQPKLKPGRRLFIKTWRRVICDTGCLLISLLNCNAPTKATKMLAIAPVPYKAAPLSNNVSIRETDRKLLSKMQAVCSALEVFVRPYTVLQLMLHAEAPSAG